MTQQHLLLPCPIRRRECAHKPHLQPLRIRSEGTGLKPRLRLYAEEIQCKSIVPRRSPIVVALHRPRHRHTTPQLVGPVDLRLLTSLSERSKREPTILEGKEVYVTTPALLSEPQREESQEGKSRQHVAPKSIPTHTSMIRPLHNDLSPKKHRFFGRDFAEYPRCKELRVRAKGVCLRT